MYSLLNSDIPIEISSFVEEVFEIIQIRGIVGRENGLKYVMHSNEANHAIPHVHAEYGEFNISIEISDKAKILAGNLPPKNERIAREWVIKHKDKLLGEWATKTISANLPYTKSNLE